MAHSVIIMDTEYTSWEGAMENDWGEDWQHREIVQIAALKIDAGSFAVLGTCDRLVRPVINPVLSDFLVDLTGITNEAVSAKGIPFAEAYQELIDFADGDTIWCYGGDGTIIAENCALNGRADWRDALEIQNLHPYFQSCGVDVSKINSGRLARHFGLDLDIQEHNAMDDVYSIHAALKHLAAEGRAMPFYNRGAKNDDQKSA